MAKKLSAFNFKVSKESHDWSALFDGSIWSLTQGEDFACKLVSMVSQIRTRAAKLGVKVKVSVDGSTVVLQASKPVAKPAGAPSAPVVKDGVPKRVTKKPAAPATAESVN